MEKAVVITMIVVAVSVALATATIINIPGDYPTIQAGINASSDSDTILVQPGNYLENINFFGHNIVLASLYLLSPDTALISSTVIDGNHLAPVVTLESAQDSSTVIIGFTIQQGQSIDGGGIFCYGGRPTVRDNIIRRNNVERWGGGLFLYGAPKNICNNTICDNTALRGAGLYCWQSNSKIIGNVISNNIAWEMGGGVSCVSSQATISGNLITGNVLPGSIAWGGGIYCAGAPHPLISRNVISDNISIDGTGGGIYCLHFSRPTIINCVISNNSAHNAGGIFLDLTDSYIYNTVFYGNIAQERGGGLYCAYRDPVLVNCIFWADTAQYGSEIYVASGTFPDITYSDVRGGWTGEGNVNIDPRFRDPDNEDFHLMALDCGDSLDSPCIDAGDPDMDDDSLSCDWGLGTSRSDMGAYGGTDTIWVSVDDDKPIMASQFSLHPNYPNPFNATTTLKYTLPYRSQVSLTIYNIWGQRVATLYRGVQQAGQYRVIWDASDAASGIYFCQMQAGEFTQVRKLLLIK
jgi:hypothetical protein